MKRSSYVILVLILAVLLGAATWAVLYIYKTPGRDLSDVPVEKRCSADSDCLPAQCCHATDCVNKDYKQPKVCNLLCTQGCLGPLDCYAGHCGCDRGRCEIIPTLA